MTKLAIVFAVLALSSVAHAALDTSSPSSAFAVAPGKIFTNGTDTAFTGLSGPCWFNGGFDNTTNYVWCKTLVATATVPYTFQRRAINASSPATINSTMDTKIASTHMTSNSGVKYCAGAGYFGFASDYLTSNIDNLYFSYAAVNASSFTKVTLTANTDTAITTRPAACFFDNNIFYIVYSTYVSSTNQTQNAVYIQGVNVTSGAVYYNSTGGVKLFSPTTQSYSTLSFLSLVGNNKTGSATAALLTYTDSSSVTGNVGSKYNVLPITLSTGAAGSVQTLATGATSSASATSVVYTTTATWTTSTTATTTFLTTYLTSTDFTTTAVVSSTTSAAASGSTVSTATYISDGTTSTQYSTLSAGVNTFYSTTASSVVTSTSSYTGYSTITELSTTVSTGTLTSTQITTYSMSAFGSLSTYGVILVQTVTQNIAQQSANDRSYTYANTLFINGSTSASTTANLTNPSGLYLSSAFGFSTSDGYCLVETFGSSTSTTMNTLYLDQYYYNGTQKTSAISLGTFTSVSNGGGSAQPFGDATGSIWVGYTIGDSANSTYPLQSASAGEALYVAGASTLSSIFAALAIMIAALFAF